MRVGGVLSMLHVVQLFRPMPKLPDTASRSLCLCWLFPYCAAIEFRIEMSDYIGWLT